MLIRLYEYRNLLIVFIWREFIVRYKQAVLGIGWALFQPISMMLLFVGVFGLALKVDTGNVPYPLFFFSGLVPWTFSSNSLSFAIPSLTNHYPLLTKIYFPREIIPLSGMVVFFFDFIISSLLYFLMMFYYGFSFDLKILMVFPLLLIMFCFILSMSLLLSSLNVYYRDVKMASSFIIQVMFFMTPVFYSLDSVDSDYKFILLLNPLAYVIDGIRKITLHQQTPSVFTMSLYSAAVLLCLTFSWRVFIKMERAFADVV